MSDTKNTQTAAAGLPKKAWFKLKEVADRWSKLTGQPVTVDDVLHYEEEAKLKIAVLLKADIQAQGIGINPDATPNRTDMPPEIIERLRVFVTGGVVQPTNCIARSIRQYGEVRFNFIEPPAGFNFAVCKIIGIGGFPHYQKLVREAVVTLEDLCITRVELDRFEQEHGLGKPAPMPIINQDTELKRAYRALGALAMRLAKEKSKYTNGNSPNISIIAAYAIDAISDEHGNTLRGYGETSIEDAIKNALALVKKEYEESKRPSK